MVQAAFNGVRQSWGSLSAIWLGRTFSGITDISINSEREITNEYGAGDSPVHRAYGNKTSDGHSFTIYHYELLPIIATLPPGKTLNDIAPSDFTLLFLPEGEDIFRKLVLPYFQVKSSGLNIASKQNDKSIPIKLTAISGLPYYKQ